jgi:hypothetical protein
MKPGTPALRAIRLLDQVRERARYLHYSLSTEKTYLHWIKFFIRRQARDGRAMRHPREMGAPEEIANAIVLRIARARLWM